MEICNSREGRALLTAKQTNRDSNVICQPIKVKLAAMSPTKQVCELMNRICSYKNSTEHHCVFGHAAPSWYRQADREAHQLSMPLSVYQLILYSVSSINYFSHSH